MLFLKNIVFLPGDSVCIWTDYGIHSGIITDIYEYDDRYHSSPVQVICLGDDEVCDYNIVDIEYLE